MDLFDEAIAAYKEALVSDPTYLKALFNLARLYHTQGEHREAITHFTQVLGLDPQHAQAYNSLGVIYEEIGNHPQAIAYLQKAVELDMFQPEAHLNLARALYHHHYTQLNTPLLQSIIERLQMTLSLAPGNHEAQTLLEEVKDLLDIFAASLT